MLAESLAENSWYSAPDPNVAWREGWGWLIRLRSIFGATAVEIALTVWSIYKDNPWYVSASLGSVATFTVVVLFLVRKYRVREIWVGKAFHHFFHFLREDVAEIIRVAVSEDDAEKTLYRRLFRQFHSNASDRIAEYFRNTTGDHSVGACIRLARGQGDEREYVTVGRSHKLNPSRQNLSEPIPIDKGVARLLRQRDQLGVYIFRDIKKAIEDDAWFETKTDRLTDIRTVMVAPINGYIVGQKMLIGILYVTSGGNPFIQMHIEPLMAFADALGFVYPAITGQRK